VNWRETPGRIFSKIRDLFDNINPPHPGDVFRTECNHLRDTANIAINSLVIEHLQNSLVLLDQELKTYNPLDGVKALKIATRQLNNMPKLNKTLKAKCLNEGMKLLGSQVIEKPNETLSSGFCTPSTPPPLPLITVQTAAAPRLRLYSGIKAKWRLNTTKNSPNIL